MIDTSRSIGGIKVVRRGSVKELSEKFIQKESSKSTEKSPAYPKAGLILRTQNSRESTPGASSFRSGSADFDDCDIEIRSTSSSSQRKSSRTYDDSETIEYRTTSTSRQQQQQQQTRSFLNSSGAKVSGVQDVLDRMRNADNGTL